MICAEPPLQPESTPTLLLAACAEAAGCMRDRERELRSASANPAAKGVGPTKVCQSMCLHQKVALADAGSGSG
eukprot:5290725-Pleurochrysis_carterae.AAC.3